MSSHKSGRRHAEKRHRSRSRSRRRDRKNADPGAGHVPPHDWRGPGLTQPPPPDWRGPGQPPSEWRPPGMYQPHGMYQPPPQRGPFQQMPPPRGPIAGYYGMPPRPEPPAEWQGPGMPPAAYSGQRGPGDPGDMWGGRPPPGAPPPGPDHWGARPTAPFQHPGFGNQAPGRESEKLAATQQGSDGTRGNVADSKGAAAGSGSVGAVAAIRDASPQAMGIVAGQGQMAGAFGRVGDGANGAEAASLPPRTHADRFRGIRINGSLLTQALVEYLRTKGVTVDTKSGSGAPASSGAGEDGGISEDAATTSALNAQCARLGLDGMQRARLPPPMPMPLRLPVSTSELAQEGLFERFRQRCGTALPADPPPMPCESRSSLGGGHVVIPIALGPPVAVGGSDVHA